MTPIRPPWRRALSAGAVAACLTGPLYAPAAALAASAPKAGPTQETPEAPPATRGVSAVSSRPSPAAPCAATPTQSYAATAGAEVLRVNRLDLRPVGRASAAVTDVGLGDTRSIVATSSATSSAATRILDGRPTAPAASTAARRHLLLRAGSVGPTMRASVEHPARTVGPIDMGAGRLTAQARWDPAMACAGVTGEISRAQALVSRAAIATGRAGRALVRVPEPMLTRSTTALERRGPVVYMVARAGIAAGTIELLGGAVRVTIVRSPTLAASISAAGAAEVRYLPAMLEVTGAGFRAIGLTTPGDEADINLAGGPDATGSGAVPVTESATATDDTSGEAGSDPGLPAVPGDLVRRLWAELPAGAPAGVTSDIEPPDSGLARPRLPGVPVLGPGEGTTADAGPDPMLRITLGDVHQSVRGHAVTARVTAVRIEITAGCPAAGAGPECATSAAVLDLDVGALDAAAVAPESGAAPGLVSGASGAAGGDATTPGATPAGGSGGAANTLPLTGARIDLTAVVGVAFLAAGLFFLFLVFGLSRRPKDRAYPGRRLRIRRRAPDPA